MSDDPLADLLGEDVPDNFDHNEKMEEDAAILTGGRKIRKPTEIKALLLECIDPDERGRKSLVRVAETAGVSEGLLTSALKRERFSYHLLRGLWANAGGMDLEGRSVDGRVSWVDLEKYCI